MSDRSIWQAAAQYLGDVLPGGVLNSEWTPERVSGAKNALVDMVPVYGSARQVPEDVRQGNYLSALMNGGFAGLDAATLGGAGLAKNALLMLATKGKDFDKIPEMLRSIDDVYRATNEIPKLKKVEAVRLADDEQAAFNSARRGLEPKLKSPVLSYNGRHHYKSRGPTPEGNDYLVDDIVSQIESVASNPLALKNDLQGPALQVTKSRPDGYGNQVRDKMVIGVDQNGRGEIFSVIPDGDGLEKWKKVQRTPLVSGDRSQPEAGFRNGVPAEPLVPNVAQKATLRKVKK